MPSAFVVLLAVGAAFSLLFAVPCQGRGASPLTMTSSILLPHLLVLSCGIPLVAPSIVVVGFGVGDEPIGDGRPLGAHEEEQQRRRQTSQQQQQQRQLSNQTNTEQNATVVVDFDGDEEGQADDAGDQQTTTSQQQQQLSNQTDQEQKNATTTTATPPGSSDEEEEECADVIAATATLSSTSSSDGTQFVYTISATISSPYETGWDKYANAFQVRTKPLTDEVPAVVLGTRILHHPHVNEQPFTRSLTGVMISAANVDTVPTIVVVAASDSVAGYCGDEFELVLHGDHEYDEPPQSDRASSSSAEVNDDETHDCSACTSYYPKDSTSTPISERGELALLTGHACGQEVTTSCCKPYIRQDDGLDACGVYWDEEFLYPCDDCAGDDETSMGTARALMPLGVAALIMTALMFGELL